jgi:molybdate transport system ATP-binding protein
VKAVFSLMTEKFLELQNVSVQAGGITVLHDIYLTICKGEQWALVGATASGKTWLARTLAGRNFYTGRMMYDELSNDDITGSILLVDQQHRFKNLSNTFELYYQQRFNSYDAEQTMTVGQELGEHFEGRDFAGSEWLEILGVGPLLTKPLIQLSNGEHKRVQLAVALLENPVFLILDNPFAGLDMEGRKTLRDIIEIISGKGIQILLIALLQDIPASITHVAVLEKGRLIYQGRREGCHLRTSSMANKLPLNAEFLVQMRPAAEKDFRIAIKMVDLNIQYGDRQILCGIDWTVKKGERWNLSGPNGAGKSTLLSLVTADNPRHMPTKFICLINAGVREKVFGISNTESVLCPPNFIGILMSAPPVLK